MPSYYNKRSKDGSGRFAKREPAPDRGQRGVKLNGCVVTYVVIHKSGSNYWDWEDLEAFTTVVQADEYINQDRTGRRLETQRRLYTKINGRYHRVNANPLTIPIRGLEETKVENETDPGTPGTEAELGDESSAGGGDSKREGGPESGSPTAC